MSDSQRAKVAWGVIAVLAVVHYDFWYWNDDSVVFGFMPVGLWFHALISLLAGIAWAGVVAFAWPTWIEEWADADSEENGA